MVRHFFGLTASSKEYILEYIYVLIRHLGFTYSDAYNLPIWKREWFVNKFIEETKAKNEKSLQNQQSSTRSNNNSRKLFNR